MMNKSIFIINGAAGSGKDTFVDLVILAAQPYDEVSNVVNFSSVDIIKELAKMIGWDGSKNEKDRKFLSDLKSLCKDYNDLPFKTIIHTVSEFYKSPDKQFLFIHIREPEEIKRAKIAFDAKTILVKRPNVSPVESNTSDKDVYNFEYDIIINNNGSIEDLSNLVPAFISDVCNNKLKSEYFANMDYKIIYNNFNTK